MLSKSYYWLLAITIVETLLQNNLITTQELTSGDDNSRFYVLSNEHGERSYQSNDIEARRRSAALDNNFMRFGRSNPSSEYNKHEHYLKRGAGDNFMRFGRAHIQSDLEYLKRAPGGGSGDNFMRFGRANHPSSDYQYKRAPAGDNFMRFGKAVDSNFMRFGRTSNKLIPNRESRYSGREKEDNFIRFGKRDFDSYDDFLDNSDDLENEDIKQRLKRHIDDGSGEFSSKSSKSDDKVKSLNNNDLERNQRNTNANFMRFGRNENFMRFGRNNNNNNNNNFDGKMKDKCPICNIYPYLNPFLTKYQQFPNWPMRNNYLDQDEKLVADKSLNSIRLG